LGRKPMDFGVAKKKNVMQKLAGWFLQPRLTANQLDILLQEVTKQLSTSGWLPTPHTLRDGKMRYPLVMTNIAMEAMALIEIDDFPSKKLKPPFMVGIFQPANCVSHNQMVNIDGTINGLG